MLRKEKARNRRSQARTVLISTQRVPMTRGASLRSRVKGNFQARFWSSGGRGDSPTDCRKLSEVDNCQVGVFMGYVSRRDHALLDFRLSLPAEWARDEQRRQACHIPEAVAYRTRH